MAWRPVATLKLFSPLALESLPSALLELPAPLAFAPLADAILLLPMPLAWVLRPVAVLLLVSPAGVGFTAGRGVIAAVASWRWIGNRLRR